MVDQFGYLPASTKIAVVRDPEKGFDAAQSFTPGKTYAVVDAATKERVVTGSAAPWSAGKVDDTSGDRAWWFDFSSLTKAGKYYVLDVENNQRSPVFRVADDVYRAVLRDAVRMLFYQRAGFPKEAKYAGEAWADGPSHVQDQHARSYKTRDDAKSERDLSGGWYDAGDYNKYTNWTAWYVVSLLRTFEQNPQAFGDDYGIPESGNGIADVIDETKYGMDWLVRMQDKDGSVLSIVGLAGGTPPSSAKGPSLYGTASTSATLSAAAAYAYGSKIFRSLGKPELVKYADDLLARAKKAWAWADQHPKVTFFNNSAKDGTQGVGAGQQEVDDYGRLAKKLMAAVHLFDATKDKKYRDFFDKNAGELKMLKSGHIDPFEHGDQQTLLYYTRLDGATPALVGKIKAAFEKGMEGTDNLPAYRNKIDPYRAYIHYYTWGSNQTKSNQGGMFMDLVGYGLAPQSDADSREAALGFLHYLHGVNPFGLVYLSNMSAAGAERSVSEIYHSWFNADSAKYKRVTANTPGPAPGYVTGGPNPSYDWDRCCPNNCGNTDNNAKCHAEPIEPPKSQPPQKSYKDFGANWPLDSWSVTEPSDGYQVAYIRLLSKFVK